MADRQELPAANRQELSEYDKGYLDGLLTGTGKKGGTWADRYEKAANEYLKQVGFEGWSVNVRRV